MRLEPAQRDTLESLIQLYVYDLSELLAIDVGANGRFATPPIDRFFSDPRCHAFLILVEDRPAGFALVQQRSRLSGDESVNDMAEFFILRRYRRRKVGERAAAWLFDHFRGRWEVRQKLANAPATAFWRGAIRFPFTEEILDDERWRGPVQRFDSTPAQ